MMLLKTFVVLAVAALVSGQRRYYSLEDMPDTNFDCRDKILGGYYADPEANCQMFHVCVKIPGQGVQDFRFLCPNETVFDQENQICADSGDIDCEASGLYHENFDLYRLGSAQASRPQFSYSKGTPVPLGPSTKSPILTNNVYEDDDFYLQKSETGDRRSHSKDILRGSSSSNFFNNRNKGKDLEEDDEEPTPKRPENYNNQFRARPSPPARPKTQFQSQFRKTEAPASSTTQQPQVENQNQLNDKKRTKVAVRKLARKRPTEEAPTQPPQQPGFSSFTTQVTQKYAFGDQNSRYNTVNRTPTTPPTVATSEVFRQQPQQPQQQQQRFQNNFRRPEQQTTLAFFEPSPTAGTFSKVSEAKLEGNKDTTPFSLLRNPIVAAGPNFQNNQNRGSTNFQQNRPTTAAGTFPSPTPTGNQPFPPQQNFQANQQNFQSNRQTTPGATGFPQQRQNNGNFQQNRPQPTPNNGNFQNQQPGNTQNQQNGNFQGRQQQQQGNFQNQQANGNFQGRQQQQQGNFQNQQANGNFQGRQQQQGNFQNQQPNGNFQQGRQQPPAGNFQNQAPANGNFQQTRQPAFQSRQTTVGLPASRPQAPQQPFNAQQPFGGQQSRQTTPQQPSRQPFNRNYDDFEEGDNQEFLKTAPSNNFRPSDLNSFGNTYKDTANTTRFAQTSTTKYYTPTIITTPRTTPAYDAPTTLRQTPFSTFPPTFAPSTLAPNPAPRSRPLSPASASPASPAAQPPASRLPQRIYPSPTAAKPAQPKDASYDYAYYDDAGSFSEYESLDNLGEPDFSRTSQRAKSRLI